MKDQTKQPEQVWVRWHFTSNSCRLVALPRSNIFESIRDRWISYIYNESTDFRDKAYFEIIDGDSVRNVPVATIADRPGQLLWTNAPEAYDYSYVSTVKPIDDTGWRQIKVTDIGRFESHQKPRYASGMFSVADKVPELS